MPEPAESARLLASLKARATNLLAEVQDFQTFLQTQKRQDSAVEVGHFQKNVQTEIKTLARVCMPASTNEPEDHEEEQLEVAKNLHFLQSTNLTFNEAVWGAAKRSRGVVALGKMMPRGAAIKKFSDTAGARDLKSAQLKTILVDLVTNDGLEWVKVSTIKKDRIIFEIAKQGWENYSYSEESNSDCSIKKPDLKLIRFARELHAASLQVRVRYNHPQVRLLLSEILEGDNMDIDAMLQDIRAIGVTVECGGRPRLHGSDCHALATSPASRFDAMLPSPPEPLTKTLNIDSTVLITLISDISHVHPSALPDSQVISAEKRSFHRAILLQISEEEQLPLLPTVLYPVLVGRKLVCTVQAAARVCQIVDTMASSTERIRASIIFAHGKYASMNEMELRQELRRYSVHPVPDEFSVAITQSNFEPEDQDAFSKSRVEHPAFPAAIAKSAADNMDWSMVNRSVLLYGWCENIVTVTSNQIVAGRLVQAINKVLDDKEREDGVVEGPVNGEQGKFRGPRIRIIQTARSLIGKRKSSEKSLDS